MSLQQQEYDQQSQRNLQQQPTASSSSRMVKGPQVGCYLISLCIISPLELLLLNVSAYQINLDCPVTLADIHNADERISDWILNINNFRFNYSKVHSTKFLT